MIDELRDAEVETINATIRQIISENKRVEVLAGESVLLTEQPRDPSSPVMWIDQESGKLKVWTESGIKTFSEDT